MATAGIDFDADGFRSGIRTAMLLSLPQDQAHWPEFVIETPGVPNSGTADADGVPWDLTAVAPADAAVRVRPVCLVETSASSATSHPFAQLQPGSAVVTLLDQEYAQVKGFSYVNLWLAGQDTPVRHYYRRVLEQPNLDVVGVWVLECRAQDEV